MPALLTYLDSVKTFGAGEDQPKKINSEKLRQRLSVTKSFMFWLLN